MNSKFEKLSKDVKENFNKEDGYWQTILDLGYAEWQSEKNDKVNNYDELIDWMRENYGDFAALAVLVGKFNQQVCNGGHRQYYDNGYASNGGGCFQSHGDEIYLHEKMVEWMEEFGFDSANELSEKVYMIMKDFEVQLDEDMYVEESCYECGGMGYVDNPDYDYEDEDSDEEMTVECPSCDGSGIEEVDNPEYGEPYNTYEWDQLDDRYYEVCDEWEKFFENFVKDAVEMPEFLFDMSK